MLGHINQCNVWKEYFLKWVMTDLSKEKTPEKSYKCKVTFNCSQWSLFPLAPLPSSPWTLWGPSQLRSSLSTSFTGGPKLCTASQI